MQTGNVTTPFGRRPAKLALVKRQMETPDTNTGRPVDKWKVFRDACEARDRLGLQDRALTVLDALLTFYPDVELKPDQGLVVFPSNAQLSVRAHGITGTTLRRHLAALVDAGLIHRRDSPNGKRYAHRDSGGEIEEAFGFDLSPLVARAAELAALAQAVAAERLRLKRSKEALTICRRDVRKLISAAMEEGADGDWQAIENMYVGLISRLSRNLTVSWWSLCSMTCSFCAPRSSTTWKISLIRQIRMAMLIKMAATYRIQNPIPSMNLNHAPKKSRAETPSQICERRWLQHRSSNLNR